MGVAKFEDLRVWQQARELCRDVSVVIRQADLTKELTLCRQLDTAALSTCQILPKGSFGENLTRLIEKTNEIGKMLRALEKYLRSSG